MFVFALLAVFYAIAQTRWVAGRPGLATQRDRAGWAMGSMFVVAGSMHFLQPAPFVAMAPPYLPAPEALVAISGVAEVAVGIGLLMKRYRKWAGLGAAALLIAVLPANIYAAQSGVPIPDYPAAAWYRWLRVALQAPLILWALAVSGLPGRRRLL